MAARVGSVDSVHGAVRAIVYCGGNPYSVFTDSGEYDVVTSQLYGPIYHQSGCGYPPYVAEFVSPAAAKPSIWIADGVQVTDGKGGVLSKRKIRAYGYQILPAPLSGNKDPFRDWTESDSVWCTVCKDHMPDDDLCRHLFWDDDVTGPGSPESKSFRQFILPVIEMACRAGIVRTWRRHLAKNAGRAQTISAVGGLGPTIVIARMGGRAVGDLVYDAVNKMYDVGGGGARLAAGWFAALGPDTKKANALTREWLSLAVQAQDERRRSGARCYAIRERYRERETALYSWDEAAYIAGCLRAHGRVVTLVYVRKVRKAAKENKS